MTKKTLINLSDRELIENSQAGDACSFEVLIERHRPQITAYIAHRRTLNQLEVTEILQRVYIKCWRKIRTFKFKSRFGTWAYVIAKNSVLDFFREDKRNRDREIPFSDCDFPTGSGTPRKEYLAHNVLRSENFDDKTPSFFLESKEEILKLKKIIKHTKTKLHPLFVQIIELVLEKGISYKEVAKEIKVPTGTVMSRLFYAKKAAQKIISQQINKRNNENAKTRKIQN